LNRFVFWVLLVTILITLPQTAIAEDGSVYVNGNKVSNMYRFKRGIKYLPLEEVSSQLGLSASKDGQSWVIRGSWRGDVSIKDNDDNILERDGMIFLSERFWNNQIGVEVASKKNSVYVFNRIVDIKTFPDGLLITAATKINYSSFKLDNPHRTVYDFKNLAIGQKSPNVNFSFSNEPFTSIRLGQFESFPHTGRVVVDHSSNGRYKPVTTTFGRLNNVFWIGSGVYKHERVFDNETVTPVEEKRGDLLSIGADGTLYFKGVKFKNVKSFYLWDEKPYRAVFDLTECKLPFDEEMEYRGVGKIKKVRIGQFEPEVARIVVELTEIIPMNYSVISKEELRIYASMQEFKKGLKVLIDPGHGGHDPGAQVLKKDMGELSADEKDVNLKLAKELGKVLTERGVQVYYTRTDDSFLELVERRNMATRLKVDLFVSVHTNSTPKHPQSYASGPEVYYYHKRDKDLAQEVSTHIAWRTGFKGRGTFFCPLVVIMNDRVPSILVEVAFLNNPTDLQALLDSNFKFGHQATLGIADGISKVFGTQMDVKSSSPQITEKPEENKGLNIFKPKLNLGRKIKQFSLDDINPLKLLNREDEEETPEVQSTAIGIPSKPVQVDEMGRINPDESLFSNDSRDDVVQVIAIDNSEKIKSIQLGSNELIEVKAIEKKQASDSTENKQIVSILSANEDRGESSDKKIEWTEEEIQKRRANIFKLY